jgi:hypothetical protein
MSVKNFFDMAAARAEVMLYGAWQPSYSVAPAEELANRAMTRALVTVDGDIALQRNDVPGCLKTFARIAEERRW